MHTILHQLSSLCEGGSREQLRNPVPVSTPGSPSHGHVQLPELNDCFLAKFELIDGPAASEARGHAKRRVEARGQAKRPLESRYS